MQKYLSALLAAPVFAISSAAHSAPFLFEFQDFVGAQPSALYPLIPGTAVGDLVTVQVIADNGGSTSIAQNWKASEILSAVIFAGTYQGVFNAPYYDAPTTIDSPQAMLAH